MTDSSPLQRRRVLYSGNVQGVGFRYTARTIARNFSVVGYVRNLSDGRVELVGEGDPDELDRFLAMVVERMSGHIREASVDLQPPARDCEGFEIRF